MSSSTTHADLLAELESARSLCTDLLNHIHRTDLSRFTFNAPVIDCQTNLPYDDPEVIFKGECGGRGDAGAGASGVEAQAGPSKRKGNTGSHTKNGNGDANADADTDASAKSKSRSREGLNGWCQQDILGWNRFVGSVERQMIHLNEVSLPLHLIPLFPFAILPICQIAT